MMRKKSLRNAAKRRRKLKSQPSPAGRRALAKRKKRAKSSRPR